MTQAQAPKVVKKKLFSPIWLLPMIAFALAAWLGIKSVRESGIEIRIHFPSAAGIDVGKTLIKYQGLTMGKVIDMSIDDQLQGVNVDVLMDYRSSPLLKQSTEFWLVTPKASITGIEGLDTLFSGNYISMLPGDGSSRSVFEAEVTAPAMPPGHKGLIINFTTDKLNSLDVGSKVFYRQIPVGQIVGYRLESSQKILMTVFIEQQYADLVKVDSQFWNVSGISVDASLAGIEVRSESLASILAGGVSFSSSTLSEPAKSHHEFNLYPDEKRALGGVDFTLTAKGTESVAINTAIVFRGMNIGRITHKTLTADGVSLAAKIDQQYAHLLAGGSVFWLEGAELSLQGINHPERLLTGSVINFIPGSGPEKQQYALKSEAPEQLDSTKRRLVLHSMTNPGISAGAQLRFKHINIGTVLSARLSPALTEVEYDVEVEADFIRLLTKGSYFVAESALEVNIDLDGIAVKTGDLNTLTSGALNLTQGDSKTLLNNGARLKVFANTRDALQDKEQSQRLHYQLQSHDAADVTQGSPVYFKKMQIGQVEHVQWQANSRDFMIKISIQKAFSSLLSNKAVFWRNSALSINASLSGVEIDVAPLEAAIKGGLSLGLLDVALPSPDHQLYDSQFLALSQSKAISLTFPAGVKLAAKAPIRYLDHQVGEIQAVKLSEDLSMLNVSAYLYGDYVTHFNQQDASFSVVDAQISLAGIKAPEALLTGPYVAVTPGSSEQTSTHFTGLIAPAFYNVDDALTFTITDSDLGSISQGTAIFFRGVKIGQVDAYQLLTDGTGVQISVHVERQYQHLVNSSSVFWDLSGIKVDLGLFSGAQIQTGSLESILAGGIGLATEAVTTAENKITPQHQFPLQKKLDPKWLEWTPQQVSAQ